MKEITTIKKTIQNVGYFDLLPGADPFVWKEGDRYHLLLKEDHSNKEELQSISVRRSPTLAGLALEPPLFLKIPPPPSPFSKYTHEIWAPEIHTNFLYVAACDGKNKNHRTLIYRINEKFEGTWAGMLNTPTWSIDTTVATLLNRSTGKIESYFITSSWPCDRAEEDCDSIQELSIARMISPTEAETPWIVIARPNAWCEGCEHAILEGPQLLDEMTLTTAENCSWSGKYNTGTVTLVGDNPLNPNDWKLSDKPLFPPGMGIGHGMVIKDENEALVFVGHRKTGIFQGKAYADGWEDRMVTVLSYGNS